MVQFLQTGTTVPADPGALWGVLLLSALLGVPVIVLLREALVGPRWVRLLPRRLRPRRREWVELERLRDLFRVPHQLMALAVMGSPTTTRKVLKHCLEQLRAQHPEASNHELLASVLMSRLATPPATRLSPGELQSAMLSIHSFEGLCDFILGLDEESRALPDALGLGMWIDEILAQEPVHCDL